MKLLNYLNRKTSRYLKTKAKMIGGEIYFIGITHKIYNCIILAKRSGFLSNDLVYLSDIDRVIFNNPDLGWVELDRVDFKIDMDNKKINFNF